MRFYSPITITTVTIEPIMDFDLDVMVEWMSEIKPMFVSIGADSKGCSLPEPPGEKVRALVAELREIAEVKLKENLTRLLPREEVPFLFELVNRLLTS